MGLSPKALLSREVKGQGAREVLEGPQPPPTHAPEPFSQAPTTHCHLHLPFWILKTRDLNTPQGSSGWVETLCFQGIWWDWSLDSWMFL